MCTERRGGRGGLWMRHGFDLKPASCQYTVLVHRAHVTRGGSGTVANRPGTPDLSIHPHPLHICSLTQEHRNAKQEHRSTGECKIFFIGTWNVKEKSRNEDTWEHKGPQEHANISVKYK